MNCPSCGYANEDGVLFCEKCKADLEMPAARPPQPPTPMTDHPAPPATAEHKTYQPEPIALEPVPLEPMAQEPVALEPVYESAQLTAHDIAPSPPAIDAAAPPPAHPVPPSVSAAAGAETVAAPVVPEVATATSGPMVAPKLVVIRGQRMDVAYPLYPGKNYLGRTDDKPVDVDLEDQEAADRIWTSRQHAVITFENGQLSVEDLNSLNGTFVNRARVHPGQTRELREHDVVQVGTVHMKIVLS